MEGIKFDDIAKLERDWLLRKADFQTVPKAILIYPKMDFDPCSENPIRLSYALDFAFDVAVCAV